MYRPKQFTLFRYPPHKTAHGGSLTKGKRKTARPISTKETMHLVLRAENAKGRRSLLVSRHARLFHRLLKTYGRKFEVKTYHYALVGNHAHLIVKAKSKRGFQNFLRVFAGQVAQQITKATRSTPLSKRFWDFLTYSRIVPWGRGFETAKKYVWKNVLEGAAILRVSWLCNSS